MRRQLARRDWEIPPIGIAARVRYAELMLKRAVNWWRRFHRRDFPTRCFAKLVVFAVVCALVCFPSPARFVRHLSHHLNVDELLAPEPEVIAPLLEKARAVIDPEAPPADRLLQLQIFVEREIPYAFDWEVWGTVDYLPTFAEVLAAGREDCDGRAVVAASLLRAMGHEARLVGNSLHMWVWTPWGETMSPQGAQMLEFTGDGWRFDWRGLGIVPESLAFGAAVFPLQRELIIAGALWLLLLSPGTSRRAAAIRAALCLATLMLLRVSGSPAAGTNWLAFAAAGITFVGIWVSAFRTRPRDFLAEAA